MKSRTLLLLCIGATLHLSSCSNDDNNVPSTQFDVSGKNDTNTTSETGETDEDEENTNEGETNEETTENKTTPYELDPNLAPSENFDLSYWYLSVPTDTDNNGKADSIYEATLNNSYESNEFFYTGSDGGMVFKCPIDGHKTSTNTSYIRTELREMLRNGNTSISTSDLRNNWVFSSAPQDDLDIAGGVDGELFATLAINKVTTTGSDSHVGRIIIGQIHANTDEPIRLYYRKLPDNELGSLYFAHELNHGSDTWINILGDRGNSTDPEDGIALDEVFSYRIKVVGNEMWVTLIREGKEDIVTYVDMSNSLYDEGDQYMYFKAGIYQGNNTGDADDYAQVTFYELEANH